MSDQTTQQDQRRVINATVVLGGLAAVALAFFVSQNTNDTKVEFLFWEGNMPTFLLILITFGLSAVLTLVGSWWMRRRD